MYVGQHLGALRFNFKLVRCTSPIARLEWIKQHGNEVHFAFAFARCERTLNSILPHWQVVDLNQLGGIIPLKVSLGFDLCCSSELECVGQIMRREKHEIHPMRTLQKLVKKPPKLFYTVMSSCLILVSCLSGGHVLLLLCLHIQFHCRQILVEITNTCEQIKLRKSNIITFIW